MPGGGASQRDHLVLAAERGIAWARELLDGGPECPDPLAYLLDWLTALHGRSGVGVDGLAPLTYGTVGEWARLMEVTVRPYEVESLMVLDSILRHPGEDKTGIQD